MFCICILLEVSLHSTYYMIRSLVISPEEHFPFPIRSCIHNTSRTRESSQACERSGSQRQTSRETPANLLWDFPLAMILPERIAIAQTSAVATQLVGDIGQSWNSNSPRDAPLTSWSDFNFLCRWLKQTSATINIKSISWNQLLCSHWPKRGEGFISMLPSSLCHGDPTRKCLSRDYYFACVDICLWPAIPSCVLLASSQNKVMCSWRRKFIYNLPDRSVWHVCGGAEPGSWRS